MNCFLKILVSHSSVHRLQLNCVLNSRTSNEPNYFLSNFFLPRQKNKQTFPWQQRRASREQKNDIKHGADKITLYRRDGFQIEKRHRRQPCDFFLSFFRFYSIEEMLLHFKGVDSFAFEGGTGENGLRFSPGSAWNQCVFLL